MSYLRHNVVNQTCVWCGERFPGFYDTKIYKSETENPALYVHGAWPSPLIYDDRAKHDKPLNLFWVVLFGSLFIAGFVALMYFLFTYFL